jgi:hypothetical protein
VKVEGIMMQLDLSPQDLLLTRRELLRRSGMGFAAVGLAQLLGTEPSTPCRV